MTGAPQAANPLSVVTFPHLPEFFLLPGHLLHTAAHGPLSNHQVWLTCAPRARMHHMKRGRGPGPGSLNPHPFPRLGKKYFVCCTLHSSFVPKRQCLRYCGLKVFVLLKLMSPFILRPLHRRKSRVRQPGLPPNCAGSTTRPPGALAAPEGRRRAPPRGRNAEASHLLPLRAGRACEHAASSRSWSGSEAGRERARLPDVPESMRGGGVGERGESGKRRGQGPKAGPDFRCCG